eukprot:6864361-Pyramimonas_sp.AAC.2
MGVVGWVSMGVVGWVSTGVVGWVYGCGGLGLRVWWVVTAEALMSLGFWAGVASTLSSRACATCTTKPRRRQSEGVERGSTGGGEGVERGSRGNLSIKFRRP